jgi:hypothetical protein
VLFPADHPDGGEAEVVPGRGDGPDVVGVRAAEGQERVVTLLFSGGEVVLQLAPLVARDVGVDEVVALEVEPDSGGRQPLIDQLRQR